MKTKLKAAILAICLFIAFTLIYSETNAAQKILPNYTLTYEDAIKSDKPLIAFFYIDWCGYCVRFAPKFETLKTIYEGKYNVVKINCDEKRALANKFGITGYPTVYIIDPVNKKNVLVDNRIYGNFGEMQKIFDEYLKNRN